MSLSQPSVWTIAPGLPFADALVSAILTRYPAEPLDLSRLTLLLPSRRAIRSVQEAFLRTTAGRAMLLPVMRAVSDIDEDEAGILGAGMEAALSGGHIGDENVLDLAPAISPSRRQLMLARLVSIAWPDSEPAQAVLLAAELARFLNQVQAEEKNPRDLANIDVGNLAGHWEIVLKVLDIIIRQWPEILEEQGLSDPAARRNALMRAQAAFWRDHPPADPVIAAGITRASPPVADLLSVVSRLPHGHVVLPGLDVALDEESWLVLDDSHPQAGMKALLEGMRATREDVAALDWAGPVPETARAALMGMVMRPAATTGAWQDHDPDLVAGLDGLLRLDCESPDEEARVIALLMRQHLEQPDKTAALVAPDRMLARRVAVELQRWGIEVDDSAGIPLAQSPVGVFLRSISRLVEEDFAPHALLALARQDLTGGPLEPARQRRMIDALEKFILRGARPGAGIEGIRKAIVAFVETSQRTQKPEKLQAIKKWADDALSWLSWLDDALAPLQQALTGNYPLDALVETHVTAAESLVARQEREGNFLWRHDDGEAAALFFGDLLDSADAMGDMAGRCYPAFLDSLIQTVTVRRKFGAHPRLFIWGNVEAQLQQADLVIIGGLNEGIWPPDPAGDPWMSRPMRRDFGLPLPEARIGDAAHDFVQLVTAPNVVMTRAEKADGVPTVPSRWLLRMDAVLGEAGRQALADRVAYWPGGDPRLWARALQDIGGQVTPLRPPEPKPPLDQRPDTLSVTRIETLLQDPYAIHAQKILGLRALDPVDADPGASERGTYIHEALEKFVLEKRFVSEAALTSPAAKQRLLDLGRECFGEMLDRPAIEAFWWPRFTRLADWFLVHQARRAARWDIAATESKGRFEIMIDGQPFYLEATADRIDRHASGGQYEIIDYKTGMAPTSGKVKLGLSCQLQLEAWMVQDGGFADLPPAPVEGLWFWSLRGAINEPGKENSALAKGGTVEELIDEASDGLIRLVQAFRDPAQPYLAVPRDAARPHFNDYEHLERIDEWILAGDADLAAGGAG